MAKKLPPGGLKLVEETSQFNEDLKKGYNDDGDGRYFLEVVVQ